MSKDGEIGIVEFLRRAGNLGSNTNQSMHYPFFI
jgi:hypothetical protein